MLRTTMSGFVSDAVLTEGVIGRRVIAWLVDAIAVGVLLVPLRLALWLIGYLTFGLGWFLAGGLWVIDFVYIIVFVASPEQATPGQALLGLRVVRDDDLGRPQPAEACVYAILYGVTMSLGMIWMVVALFTRRGRCLHDILSGLLVVRADAVAPAAGRGWTEADGSVRP
jgi:uncharacterized RDD family membrane protein YckC